MLWFGTTATALPLCSGCDFGTETAVVLGTGSISTQIPCEPARVGGIWYAQGAGTGVPSCRVGALDIVLSGTVQTDVGG